MALNCGISLLWLSNPLKKWPHIINFLSVQMQAPCM